MPSHPARTATFFIMKRADPASVIETVAQLCAQRLPKHYGFTTAQIQVLSLAKRHGSGTIPLNRRLQEALNHLVKASWKSAWNTIFREGGDRVMQVPETTYDIVCGKSRGRRAGEPACSTATSARSSAFFPQQGSAW